MPEAEEVKKSDAQADINLRTNPDPILRDLVCTVRGTNAEVGITLMVGGILVSGLIVSLHLYLEHLRTEIEKVCQDKGVVGLIQKKCDEGKQLLLSPISEESPPPPVLSICLKDARFFHPGKDKESTEGVWWRGRISEIDGFSLGRMDEAAPLLGKSMREQIQVEDT